MGTVRYTVFDGEITSEYRNGVLHDYLVDPLGSTVALVDNTQTITDTFSYSAFGEVVNRTGTTPTPFQYVGSKGYYKDSSSRTYVRARNFNVNLGRWMTQDPIWFDGGDWNLYRYCENNPVLSSDASGLGGCFGCASGLFLQYRWTLAHLCLPCFVHCLSCCILTRHYGESCAARSQNKQDWTDPFLHRHRTDPKDHKHRMECCKTGIDLAPEGLIKCDVDMPNARAGQMCQDLCWNEHYTKPKKAKKEEPFPKEHKAQCVKYMSELTKPMLNPCYDDGTNFLL